MDDKRIDLQDALRELAADDSGAAGAHVGSKRLIAYRQGTLPAAEREAVQEHLSLCARCTGLLRELRDFEAAAVGTGAAGPESLRHEAWESLVRHLPAKTPSVRPVAAAAGSEAPRPRPALRGVYAAAAALLLAVLGLCVWAAVTVQEERRRLARLEQRLAEREEALAVARRSLAEAERQLAAARGQVQDLQRERRDRPPEVDELRTRIARLTSELERLRRAAQAPEGRDRLASRAIELSAAPRFALRGQEPPLLRGKGAVNPVHLPARAERFTVALSLADDPVYDEYRLELVDRDGLVLWTGRRPGPSILGDAGTSVSIQGLGPGLYRLRIEGLRQDRTQLLAEYLLAIESPKTQE